MSGASPSSGSGGLSSSLGLGDATNDSDLHLVILGGGGVLGDPQVEVPSSDDDEDQGVPAFVDLEPHVGPQTQLEALQTKLDVIAM